MAKKKSSRKPKTSSLPHIVVEGLYEADRLLDDGKPEDARQILEELDRRYPGITPVLELLVNACYDLQDMFGYEWALYRLLQINRNNPDVVLGLAGAYMSNVRPALAIQTFEKFLRRWPDHENAQEARQSMEEFQSVVEKEMEKLNLPRTETLELVRQSEEVNFFMDHGEYQRARKRVEKLLKKHPDYVPAINNLGQIRSLQGDREQAIDLARKVLEIEPDNVHALSNLARLLFLAGNPQEAARVAERLKTSQAPAADVWTKKAEGLAYLADFDGIEELHQQAKTASKAAERSPLFLHLVAVAKYNLGQEDEARRLWQQALQLRPGFYLASKNLEDLELPIGEQNAPWAFSLNYWINEKIIRDLFRALSKSEQSAQTSAGKILERNPELIPLAPHMLQHGDGAGREFVLGLAKTSRDPALLEAIKEFALGQRGSDKLRLQAANLSVEAGLLPAGPVRMWAEGEWRDLMMLDFEITTKVEGSLSNPQAQSLLEQAYYALKEMDGARAQKLLEEAISIDPDNPSLHNNLAMAYEITGQTEKAHALLHEIYDRFPDYFFGIAGMARLATHNGDLERAHELLDRLLKRRKLHVTEYNTLCASFIELYLAESNHVAARTWFEMWDDANPDNPELDSYRRRIGK